MFTSSLVISTPGNQRCTPGLHETNFAIKFTHLKLTVYSHNQASKQAYTRMFTMQSC